MLEMGRCWAVEGGPGGPGGLEGMMGGGMGLPGFGTEDKEAPRRWTLWGREASPRGSLRGGEEPSGEGGYPGPAELTS